jgi:hypothetical protein
MPRIINSSNELISNGFPKKQNLIGIKLMTFFDCLMPSISDRKAKSREKIETLLFQEEINKKGRAE